MVASVIRSTSSGMAAATLAYRRSPHRSFPSCGARAHGSGTGVAASLSPGAALPYTSPEPVPLAIPFDNSYARLPERFHAHVAPTPVRAPRLIRLNAPLARDLGIEPEALASAEGLEVLAGNRVP